MKAYQTNNGYFEAEINCQESPLEPGKFLIPAGAVLEEPPIKSKDSEFISRYFEKEKKWFSSINPKFVKLYSKTTGQEKYFPPDAKEEEKQNYTEKERPNENSIFWENDWIDINKKYQIEQTRLYLETTDQTIKIPEEIRELLYNKAYNQISNNVKSKIENGFESACTGIQLLYDSSLTDQFEINKLADLKISAEIKATGKDNIKRRYPHTEEQIQKLTNEFFLHVFHIKLVGDQKKLELQTNYLNYSLDELKNYDTEV